MATRRLDPSRIAAVDTARGLAMVGMIAAHSLDPHELSWTDPASWEEIASGRSAILFAVLGGISLALTTGRTRPPTGSDLLAARLRVVVRACLLFVIGGILTVIVGRRSLAVILEFYAVMFVFAVPFLTWRPRRLLTAIAVWAVIAPILLWWLPAVLPGHKPPLSGIIDLAATGSYPALLWIVFILIGLAIGRSDVTAPQTRKRLLGWGIASAVIGYAAAWSATRLFIAPTDDTTHGVVSLLTAEPHSGTLFEIAGSAGVVAAILGLLLSLPSGVLRILAPLTAIGYLPLTVYTGHVLSMVIFMKPETNGTHFFLISVAVIAVAALLWTRFLGRGPLERMITWVARAAVRTRELPLAATPGPAPRNAGLREESGKGPMVAVPIDQ
ncbi:heparan-alpha-glucosaminide N-acetyltransferase domain-containing protein [Nocardia sp. NPDC051570]|uniref:heparan-alpha-glucosaminide N-acetyltransferase domain-containing protein n=1 Tax=Nocardia sp. NPDC051570 TaxID=3364324 RepID=UPI0037A5F755